MKLIKETVNRAIDIIKEDIDKYKIQDWIKLAVGNLVKRLQDIMRKDAGLNSDAQRIEQMVWL
jgi:hypothetical protein